MTPGMGGRHPHHFHSRRPPRLHAGGSILKHHTPAGLNPQVLRDFQKNIRGGFAALHMFRRDGHAKEVLQPKFF